MESAGSSVNVTDVNPVGEICGGFYTRRSDLSNIARNHLHAAKQIVAKPG